MFSCSVPVMQAMAIPSLRSGIMWLITLPMLQRSAWNYIEYDAYQSGKMPMMDQVLVCGADSGFVALGSNGKWYKSKNQRTDMGCRYTRNHASRILCCHPALRLLPRQGQILLGSQETAAYGRAASTRMAGPRTRLSSNKTVGNIIFISHKV